MFIKNMDQINEICPWHDLFTCSDENPCNGFYELQETKYEGITIDRELVREPQCNRCFLIQNIGFDTLDLKLLVRPTILIKVKKPLVKLEVIEE